MPLRRFGTVKMGLLREPRVRECCGGQGWRLRSYSAAEFLSAALNEIPPGPLAGGSAESREQG